MAVTQKEIDDAQAAADLLRQQKVNEDGAPISQKFLDDVIAGTVTAPGASAPKALANIAAKGITTEADVVDGEWVTISLPTDTATAADKVLLKAFCATLQAKGAQLVSLGDPVKLRWGKGERELGSNGV
jgi:hypothetical protein